MKDLFGTAPRPVYPTSHALHTGSEVVGRTRISGMDTISRERMKTNMKAGEEWECPAWGVDQPREFEGALPRQSRSTL
jgi:hypothetical protein